MSTAVVYWPVTGYDFVNYDDADYVTANPHVQGGLTWNNVIWAFKTGHASNWHPLTWISHMVDWQLFGQHAGGHHLVSLLLHIANTLLLFLLFRTMTGAVWPSALIAALFEIHPLHVESVVWIAERKDVLSTFFLLLTLWAYARYAAKSRVELEAGGAESRGWYLCSLGFFALGLLSKPMLVTLPFVLLLLDYWPLKRVSRNESIPMGPVELKGLPKIIRPLVWEKLPFLLLSAVSSVITFLVQREGGTISAGWSLGERVANALVSYVRYIGKMLWPAHLSAIYPHPGQWPSVQVALCAVLLLAISLLAIRFSRSRPYLLVGWLWFVGMLVPVIGLVQVGIQSMADRYSYVPLVGLFIMAVWGGAEAVVSTCGYRPLCRLREGDQETRKTRSDPYGGPIPASAQLLTSLLPTSAILSLLACALLTSHQLKYWRNSEALFRHATEATRNNYLAYNNLGYFLSCKGQTEEAIENYRLSLRINPDYEQARNNLGYALAAQKKYAEAIAQYEMGLRANYLHALDRGRRSELNQAVALELHDNLANALAQIGKNDEAIAHYLLVLSQKPDHAEAHSSLGIALAMQGKLDEAIAHLHEAIRLNPDLASAHSNLGNALALQHKLDEAITEYQQTLRLDPNEAQAHNNLASALLEQSRLDAAIPHYQEALRLKADSPEIHYNLAMALLAMGKREEAAAHFKEVVRLKPDHLEAQRQLDELIARPSP